MTLLGVLRGGTHARKGEQGEEREAGLQADRTLREGSSRGVWRTRPSIMYSYQDRTKNVKVPKEGGILTRKSRPEATLRFSLLSIFGEMLRECTYGACRWRAKPGTRSLQYTSSSSLGERRSKSYGSSNRRKSGYSIFWRLNPIE